MVSLLDLPLEVLEVICRPLKLRDRLALTSCCRTLLARPDVAGSAQLWGSLGRQISLPRKAESRLAGFLTRHVAGLRTLNVELATKKPAPAVLAALLGTLGGSGVVDLDILGPEGLGMDPDAALQPLSRLTALTHLTVCSGLRVVPAQVSALQRLVDLDLSDNMELGESGSPATFESLDHLLALTSLDLSNCGLRALPPQLSLLTRLQVLLLHDNIRLGEGGEAAFEGLRLLPALRTLDLSACGLQVLPWQLAALPALEVLDLGRNEALGSKDPAVAVPVLCKLAGLTRLSMRGCRLRRAPPQLASLTALASLELGGNLFWSAGEEEEEGGDDPFLPLERLTALTRLDLKHNALPAVPPQVAALTRLVELDLRGNRALGEAVAAAFRPLQRLSALTLLNLSTAGLRSLPPQLSALGSCLVELDLSNNGGLGLDTSGQAFQLLRHATEVTALHLERCSLKRLPLELSALGALRQLELECNERLGLEEDYEQAFGPLRPLRGLTYLGLSSTGLRRLPPQLSALRALRELDVRNNWALGQGEQAHPETWHLLSGLPALERLRAWFCGVCTPAPPALLELARQGVNVIL